MMPRKLFQRMTDEQEQMAKAFVEGDIVAYEKAEAEQEKLMGAWYNKMDADQHKEWSAVCARLDTWVSKNAPNIVCTGQVAGGSALPLFDTLEHSPVKAAGSEPAATCR